MGIMVADEEEVKRDGVRTKVRRNEDDSRKPAAAAVA